MNMPKTKYEPQSAESLERIADSIQESASQLRGYAAMMSAENIASMRVGNTKSLHDGLEKLDSFISAVRISLVRARGDSGRFRSGDDK